MRTIVFNGIQAITSSLNELEEGDGTAAERQHEMLALRDEIYVAIRKLKEESLFL